MTVPILHQLPPISFWLHTEPCEPELCGMCKYVGGGGGEDVVYGKYMM